jgi:hypothetical protein
MCSVHRDDLPAVPATTTAPAAAASTAISTTVASAAARPLRFRTSLIYVQRPAAQLRAVDGRNCLIPLFRAGHFHEAEAPRSASIAVGHNADSVHLSVCLEHLAQVVFRRVEIKVAYEDVLQTNRLWLSYLSVGEFGAQAGATAVCS